MSDFGAFFRLHTSTIAHAKYLPSYKLLELVLVAGLSQGLWKEGDLLPPERKLAQECGLSVGTVKRAMLDLVHEGLLYRRQGSGTYVAGPSFARQQRQHYLFLDNFDGVEQSTSISMCKLERMEAQTEINTLLGLDPHEELLLVARVISEADIPVVYCQSWLCASRFAGLESMNPNRLENVPLYILLKEIFDTPSVRIHELLDATSADAPTAAMLQINAGEPLLHIRALSYDRNDMPFEYRKSYCLTRDKALFRTQ